MSAGNYFNLHLPIDYPDTEKIIADFRKSYKDAEVALNEKGSSLFVPHWYDHEEDLKEFSKKYPDILFVLWCESENGGDDAWKVYAKNGKSYSDYVVISYPEFDETKMI